MANLNKMLMIGRLTRKPELRYTQGGTPVCEFGIAVNREWTDSNNEKQKEVLFIDVVAWARRAEVMAQYLDKGSQVFIEGHLRLEQWEDRETKARRSKHKVVVDNFQFLGGRADRTERPDGDGNPADNERGDGPGDPSQSFPVDQDVPF